MIGAAILLVAGQAVMPATAQKPSQPATRIAASATASARVLKAAVIRWHDDDDDGENREEDYSRQSRRDEDGRRWLEFS